MFVRDLAPLRVQRIVNVSFQLLVVEVMFDGLHVPTQFRTQALDARAGALRVSDALAAGLADAEMPGDPQQIVRRQFAGDEEFKPVRVWMLTHILRLRLG